MRLLEKNGLAFPFSAYHARAPLGRLARPRDGLGRGGGGGCLCSRDAQRPWLPGEAQRASLPAIVSQCVPRSPLIPVGSRRATNFSLGHRSGFVGNNLTNFSLLLSPCPIVCKTRVAHGTNSHEVSESSDCPVPLVSPAHGVSLPGSPQGSVCWIPPPLQLLPVLLLAVALGVPSSLSPYLSCPQGRVGCAGVCPSTSSRSKSHHIPV